MKGDEFIEKESGKQEIQLNAGERIVVEFNMPWKLVNLE